MNRNSNDKNENLIYSNSFLSFLKNTLDDPKKFIKSNKSVRKRISDKIKKGFVIEDFTKTLSKQRIKYSLKSLDDYLEKEKKILDMLLIIF